jgi:uncharacterized SAM-binding protein YcdF (DUF218 family)
MFFYFLHNVLPNFTLPPLNAMLLIIVGLIVIKQHQKIAYTLFVLSLILLYIQSTPFFVYNVAQLLELPPITKSRLEEAEAIVVLGGGTKTNTYEYNLQLMPNRWTMMRLEYTAYLARQYPNKIIVVSGGMVNNKKNAEADVMARILRNEYHIKNPIIIEDKSSNTNENAKFVSQMLKKLQIYNVIVITQAYHSIRASTLFNQYGLHATAAPTDYSGSYRNHSGYSSFIPNANAMHTCEMFLHEIYGYIIYITFKFHSDIHDNLL